MFSTNVHRFVPFATPAETCVTLPCGTRLVTGPLGTVEYDTNGNARFLTVAEAAVAASVARSQRLAA